MGTLDDAIREHLELKRKHGAEEDELKELEDSAFGPPERPGAESEAELEAEATGEEGLAGDVTTVMPSGEAAPADLPAPADDAAEIEPSPSRSEASRSVEESEMTPAEQARQEYPQLGDTESHEPVPGPEPVAGAEPATSRPPEPEPASAPEHVQSTEEQDALEIGLFESDDDEEDFDVGEIDLDLDVDLDEEDGFDEPVEESAREHSVIESRAGLVDPDPTDESQDVTGGEEGHDVLEETPEFLRDAPESDEMWFEQDEPKDFDFD